MNKRSTQGLSIRPEDRKKQEQTGKAGDQKQMISCFVDGPSMTDPREEKQK